MKTQETAEKNEMMTPVEQIVLDTQMEKYKLVSIATRWIDEISKKEEYKYLTFNQLLEVALKDILTGKISPEEIKKLPPLEKRRPRAQAGMDAAPVSVKKPSREIKADESEKKSKKKKD